MKDSVSPAPRSRRGRSFAETRGAILDLIRSSGEISRGELARRSALTEATISKAVKVLLAEKVIVESGYAESTGGKRPTLLRLVNSGRWALGVILDHFRIVATLCGIDGSQLASIEIPGAGEDDAETVLLRVTDEVLRLLDRNGVAKDAVIGLGIAVSGRRIEHFESGTAPLEAWWQQPFVAGRLQELTGLEVLQENDANCAALGEFWSGRVPDDRDFALVYLADGVGVGLIINGDAYRGRSGHFGEIGHSFVDPSARPCWCGSFGCLNTVGTPQAIAQTVLASPQRRADWGIGIDESPAVTYSKVAALARAGEPVVKRAVEDAAEFLATAVVSLVNIVDLDRIILAGPGLSVGAEVYFEAVQKRVQSTYMSSIHAVEVELREASADIAALGAAALVLHRRLTPQLNSQ
jgi:predicted NBD/HSP70 family sugar kinase